LILKSQAADVGESRVELPIAYTGPDLTITFDPRFVSDFLKVLGPETSVKLELISSEDAAVLRTEDGFTYVIMPCRGIDNSMGSTSGPLHISQRWPELFALRVTPASRGAHSYKEFGTPSPEQRSRGRLAWRDQSRRAASGCGKRLPARRTGRIPQIGPLKISARAAPELRIRDLKFSP